MCTNELTTCSALLRFSCTAALLLCSTLRLSAQTCPFHGTDIASLTDQVERTTDPGTIYRAAAIAGKSLAPVLRSLSKADMGANTIPGAAQVSLAKLNDEDAMEQLLQEMKGKSPPIRKLVRVGDDRAISILMTFVVEHRHDESLQRDFGDYTEDIRYEILDLLAKQLEIGPLVSARDFSVSIGDWVAWWDLHKDKPIALSISSRVGDPYLQCLARKVEWGFPNAIFDMANAENAEVLPVLRILERVGRQDFTLKTIHGRAQFALAKLGDEESFGVIARDLDVGEYDQSTEALQMLGGKQAVAALVNAMNTPEFARYHLSLRGADPEAITAAQRERDDLIIRILSTMVANPPPVTGDLESRKKQWKDWWGKNKDTAQFVSVPVKRYE